jgi:hypothetical protein
MLNILNLIYRFNVTQIKISMKFLWINIYMKMQGTILIKIFSKRNNKFEGLTPLIPFYGYNKGTTDIMIDKCNIGTE